jgi:hypothetical protein
MEAVRDKILRIKSNPSVQKFSHVISNISHVAGECMNGTGRFVSAVGGY